MLRPQADIMAVNQALLGGGIVLLPTETVYGLAVDATNQAAVDKLYGVKGRDFNKPIAICIQSIAQAAALVHWNGTAQKLAEMFWPGPLSLVLPAKDELGLDPRLFGKFLDGTPSLSLRFPQVAWHAPLTIDYLALTSANKSGQPDMTEFQPAFDIFKDDIDAAIKGSTPPQGQPSTVLSIESGHCRLLREGALKRADFAAHNLPWYAP